MNARACCGLGAITLAMLGCSAPSCPTTPGGAARDFTAFPAIHDQPSFTRLLGLSDVHGGYDRMIALLARWGVIASAPVGPGAAEWTGGDATLVVTGDLIDKGSQSVEVLDFFRALGADATARGGQIVVTLGNHEAEFLADPYNAKADTFDRELDAQGLDPCVVATTEPRGVWLRTRPIGARMGDWFFAHAGQTHGRTVAALEQTLELAIARNDFRDNEIIGPDSILEARAWWEAPAGSAQGNATELAVAHIVFGHTPDALDVRGAIGVGENGLLFRIDTGMSPAVDDSQGSLLEITHDGADEVATELRADGVARPLWRGPKR